MDNIEIQNIVNKWSCSFLRPHVPPFMMKKSIIKKTEDDGAKLIYAKFLYGEQRGTFETIPFDGSYGNKIKDLKQESLWLYSTADEKIPSGFVAKSYENGMIRTGIITKCKTCRGQGTVTCAKCKGKIRWTVKRGDRYVEKICSCGNGKQICEKCTGYGDVETIILRKTIFRLFETNDIQYHGEVPLKNIEKITGNKIFEHVVDYPMNELRKILTGGIDKDEYLKLNRMVLDDIHYKINTELFDKKIDIRRIHDLINALFTSVPNPCLENVPMEKETIPVRVMLRVEDAPVTQVEYSFGNKDFSLWVVGNENRIWYKSIPFTFNYKIIVWLFWFIILIVLTLYFF